MRQTAPSKRSDTSTLRIFTKYIVEDNFGNVYVNNILSLECYNEWLQTRKMYPKNPAEAFRKILTGHCRGDNNLLPFEPRVESAILKLLRKQQVWECFKGTDIKIGQRGFKTQGFWERCFQTAPKCRKRSSSDLSCRADNHFRTRIISRTRSWHVNLAHRLSHEELMNDLFLREAEQTHDMNMDLSAEEIFNLSS